MRWAPIPIGGTKGALSYGALLDFWAQFDPYTMNTMLVSNDMMLAMLKLSEFQNPNTGLNFQATGKLTTPLGAKLLRSSAVPSGTIIGLDKTTRLNRSAAAKWWWSMTSSLTASWSGRPLPRFPALPSCLPTRPRC